MKKTTSTVVFTRLCPTLATALLLSIAPALIAQESDIWTGNDSPGNQNWTDANNWSDALNAAPSPYDSLNFAGGNTANNNNFAPGTAFDGITFSSGASSFNLSGNSLLLSGNYSGNSNGIVNNSATAQTVSLNLNLDWGYYYMMGGSGTLALNGTLTPNAGGVAFFDPNVTSTSLTSDSGGLIAGLGGAGLMSTTAGISGVWIGTNIPSGLAALSGGAIVAYNYSTDPNAQVLANGTIPNGANYNVELTGTGLYTWPAGTTYLNTILATSSSTATSVQSSPTNTASVMVLGTNNNGSGPYIGAILAPNIINGKSGVFTLGDNAQTLTAGPMSGAPTPGTIVVAVNGGYDSGGNQAYISPKIVNNGSGGAVALVFTGNGNVNVNSGANTYSGGTYINSGSVQFGGPAPASSASSCGTGPIYVASNTTVYFNVLNSGISTIANNFFVSPGNGAPSSDPVESPTVLGGAVELGATFNFSGTINLMGDAVAIASGPGGLPTSIGCRFTSPNTVSPTFTGLITGTGTLDITAAHSPVITLDNSITSGLGTNNFSGGVILDAPEGHGVSVQLVMGANNQLAGGNVTILAPGTTAVGERFDLHGTTQIIGALNGAVQSGAPLTATTQNLITNSASSTAATLIMGANNQNGCYEGLTPDRAAAPLNFTKIGTGTQVFDGIEPSENMLFHGSLTVESGDVQLLANASVPNASAIVLYSGAILDGTQLNGNIIGSIVGSGVDISNQMLIGTGSLYGATLITNGATVITTNPASGAIGTLNLNGAGDPLVTWAGNSTLVFDINNASGTAGADPGWSLVNVSNSTQLQITAQEAAPITINITSLNGSDQPGNATFNPNVSQAWMIASTPTTIQGFNPNQFAINIANAGNLGTAGASAFSVANTYGSDNSGDNLYLVYTSTPVIQTELANQTAINGGTVSYTVAANGTGITYNWSENGNPIGNGSTSGGGNLPTGNPNITITTNNGANSGTSTLTITNVQYNGDDGADNISVDVTSSLGSEDSAASLTVITTPNGINESSSLGTTLPNTPVAQGAAVDLTAQAVGQENNTFLNYQWYSNGVAILGATNSSYLAAYSATASTYTVSASDDAGSYTNTTANVIGGAITFVPNQMIFEPFNYQFQTHDQAVPWTAIGKTNVYNQLTGVGVGWVNVSGDDMDCELPIWNQAYAGLPSYDGGIYGNTNIYDFWPWHGLADSYGTNDYTLPGSDGIYQDSAHNADINLPFGLGGSVTNGDVYFSFVINMGQGGALSGTGASPTGYEYLCGLGYDNGDPTSVNGVRNAGVYIYEPGNDTYQLGIFKTSGTTNALNPGVNGNWSPNILIRDETIFVVGHLYVNPLGSGSTVDLWIDPNPSTFYAATPPTPDVAAAGGSAPDVGSADFFYSKITTFPASRTYAILRIGTTWASVTPPAAPTLSVNNVVLNACTGQTAVFTSQNAGNPVTQGYGWTFNNAPLTDTTLPDMAQIIGSSTSALTIVNPTGAEVGTYTVTGTNLDQDTLTNLTGSASGTLSFLQPPLSIVYNNGNVTISWPTANGSCFTLEQTPSLSPASWTTIPGPYTISGANYVVTMAAPANPMYYQLIASP